MPSNGQNRAKNQQTRRESPPPPRARAACRTNVPAECPARKARQVDDANHAPSHPGVRRHPPQKRAGVLARHRRPGGVGQDRRSGRRAGTIPRRRPAWRRALATSSPGGAAGTTMCRGSIPRPSAAAPRPRQARSETKQKDDMKAAVEKGNCCPIARPPERQNGVAGELATKARCAASPTSAIQPVSRNSFSTSAFNIGCLSRENRQARGAGRGCTR